MAKSDMVLLGLGGSNRDRNLFGSRSKAKRILTDVKQIDDFADLEGGLDVLMEMQELLT